MMLAELIAQLVQSLLNWGLGGAAAFVLLVLTLALYALQVRLLGAPFFKTWKEFKYFSLTRLCLRRITTPERT